MIKAQGKIFTSTYEVERIIIDSDFDGVMCGAMLRIVFPDIEIIQSRASEIQEGQIDHLITKKTLMVDLRYSPLCGYFFDHHESNQPDEDFVGAWVPVESAAQVIYSSFEDIGDFSNFTSLMDDINKFDSGNISIEDFKNPNDLYKLALIINRDDKYFNLWLVELLARMPLAQVCRHPYVKERIDNYFALRESMSKYVKENSQVIENTVFVDLSNYRLKEKLTSYVYTAEFPGSRVIVVTKPPDELGWRKVRLYRNNFFYSDHNLNLLNVALRMNPRTAGGHKGACGFSFKEVLDNQKLARLIQEELASGTK